MSVCPDDIRGKMKQASELKCYFFQHFKVNTVHTVSVVFINPILGLADLIIALEQYICVVFSLCVKQNSWNCSCNTSSEHKWWFIAKAYFRMSVAVRVAVHV